MACDISPAFDLLGNLRPKPRLAFFTFDFLLRRGVPRKQLLMLIYPNVCSPYHLSVDNCTTNQLRNRKPILGKDLKYQFLHKVLAQQKILSFPVSRHSTPPLETAKMAKSLERGKCLTGKRQNSLNMKSVQGILLFFLFLCRHFPYSRDFVVLSVSRHFWADWA